MVEGEFAGGEFLGAVLATPAIAAIDVEAGKGRITAEMEIAFQGDDARHPHRAARRADDMVIFGDQIDPLQNQGADGVFPVPGGKRKPRQRSEIGVQDQGLQIVHHRPGSRPPGSRPPGSRPPGSRPPGWRSWAGLRLKNDRTPRRVTTPKTGLTFHPSRGKIRSCSGGAQCLERLRRSGRQILCAAKVHRRYRRAGATPQPRRRGGHRTIMRS